MTTPPTPEAASLIKLLTWLSPAFPTGNFAYSHALEWAVESNDVTSEPTLEAWLHDLLTHGSGHTDAILLRHAHRATTPTQLAHLAELAEAATPTKERRAETLALGDAFTIATQLWPAPLLDAQPHPVPYPIALGARASAHHIPEDANTTALLHAFATSLTSAAIRLIPLGQTAGLRVVARLEPTIHATAQATKSLTLEDIGTACFRADIASMRHETQYTRLFRT